MKAKLWHLNSLLYLALLLALLSSLGHVAFAFSTVNGQNWTEAYISAVAIDVGLVTLAAGINQRKTQRRATTILWAGVGFFSLISIYANWLAGLAHVADIPGHSDSWLVSLRPILLSAVLPVLVIYLSEIASGNHQVDQAAAQRELKRQAKRESIWANEPGSVDTLTLANENRADQKAERMNQALDLLRQGMSRPAVASELGVSVSTVKRYAKELNGRAHVGQDGEQ